MDRRKPDIQEIRPGDYDSSCDKFRTLSINIVDISPGEMHSLIAAIRAFCKDPKSMPEFEGVTHEVEEAETPKERMVKAETKEKKAKKLKKFEKPEKHGRGSKPDSMKGRIIAALEIEQLGRKEIVKKLKVKPEEMGNFYVSWSVLKKKGAVVPVKKGDEKGPWRAA